MGAMKPMHWLVLLLVILLLFGAKKLPDLARSVGQSMKIFKKEIKELQDDDAPAVQAPTTSAAPEAPKTVTPSDSSQSEDHEGKA
ncbi:Sec-independent protein translocase subunit TatA [Timonella senegalensis]|uniref:Sec-independent protein translocase subunit TatA n=2 Tax=Timonella senegalensis TaxID=1465825 RepID=UPI002FDEDCB0